MVEHATKEEALPTLSLQRRRFAGQQGFQEEKYIK